MHYINTSIDLNFFFFKCVYKREQPFVKEMPVYGLKLLSLF